MEKDVIAARSEVEKVDGRRSGRELYEVEVCDWTDAELEQQLRASYEQPEVPTCRVCGGELSLQACGGGRPHRWACSGLDEQMRYLPGRKPADEHYIQSEWEDRRQGGDQRVIELLRRYSLISVPSQQIVDIADRMATQDNACTAHPIFIVEQKERIYGMDTDYTEYIAWIYDGEPWPEDDLDRQAAEAHWKEHGEEPEGWTRTGYLDRWAFVQPFFTRSAAEAYIAANRHRLADPRVYVDSAYRNREWQAVVELITLSLIQKKSISISNNGEGDVLDPRYCSAWTDSELAEQLQASYSKPAGLRVRCGEDVRVMELLKRYQRLDPAPLLPVLQQLEKLTTPEGRAAFVLMGPMAIADVLRAWEEVPEQWRKWSRQKW